MKSTRRRSNQPGVVLDALAPLAKLLAQLVAAELEHSASAELTSAAFRKGDDPDADTSLATFHKACRSGEVDGAEKRGRSWACPRESWREYRRRAGARAARYRRYVLSPEESRPIPFSEGAERLLAELDAQRVG